MKADNTENAAAFQMNTAQWWNEHDFVVPQDEIVVVQCGSKAYIKVGDGKTLLSQLSYVQESQKKSLLADHRCNAASAQASSQNETTGHAYKSTENGLFCIANAPFSTSTGYNSRTLSSDDFSFVWNGDTSKPLFYKYESHGKGTMNFNPAGGIEGIWIGDKTLKQCIEDEVKGHQQTQPIVYVKQTVKPNAGIEIAQINKCPIYAPKDNNAKITLRQNGRTIGAFSLNASKDQTIEIPAASNAQKASASMQKQIDELKAQIEELKKMIPTKTSQLKNDTKFVTSWSIGNGQITFKKDGQTIGSFGANSTSSLTVDI